MTLTGATTIKVNERLDCQQGDQVNRESWFKLTTLVRRIVGVEMQLFDRGFHLLQKIVYKFDLRLFSSDEDVKSGQKTRFERAEHESAGRDG